MLKDIFSVGGVNADDASNDLQVAADEALAAPQGRTLVE